MMDKRSGLAHRPPMVYKVDYYKAIAYKSFRISRRCELTTHLRRSSSARATADASGVSPVKILLDADVYRILMEARAPVARNQRGKSCSSSRDLYWTISIRPADS